MTIQQTIDIPVSRKVHFDVSLPEDAPCGPVEVLLTFNPVETNDRAIDPRLAEILQKAAKRAEREQTDPVYRKKLIENLKECQKGGPVFGGISTEEFKRKCNDEWEDRTR